MFLAHLSWKLKWVLSVVGLYVCLSDRVFSHLHLLLQNRLNNLKLDTQHPLVWEIHICSNKGLRAKGDNNKITDIHWQYLKIFYSRITEPISSKHGTKHSWMKGIQIYSKDKPSPSSRRVISKYTRGYQNVRSLSS